MHRAVERRAGRYVTRRWLKTRISPEGWKLIPMPPAEAAAKIAPVPLLIVHGDQDIYFPPEHARQLYQAAREPKELWLLPGMGHAESACSQELVDRIGRWVDRAVRDPAAVPDLTSVPAAPEPDGSARSRPRRGNPGMTPDQARPASEWVTTQIACTGSSVLFRYSCGVEESNAIESPGPSS